MVKTAVVIYWHENAVTVRAGDQKKEKFVRRDLEKTAEEIIKWLKRSHLLEMTKIIACPGAVLKPLKKGCYIINDQAAMEAEGNSYGKHVYNWLTVLAYKIGKSCGLPAVMMYPMSCDELLPLNRITSNAFIKKYSRYHALEHQAGLRRLEEILKARMDDRNCIIAYVDELTSVGAYERGICLDVNDCIGAEGPMGLNSSGDIPVAKAAEYFQSMGSTYEKIEDLLLCSSGLRQYTGISNIRMLDKEYCKNEAVKVACESLAYQVAKWIGSSTLVLKGKVDAILLAGRGMESERISALIEKKVEKIAPVFTTPDLRVEEWMEEAAKQLGTYACPLYEY
ncbi:hypothetical protein [[Clostridium] scindens]|uniref:hypothetical protein n=1 Tax=Clostridium scindens (strain JCM 10418 / VPI 12708) TaxID=29347 RepID=UPI001D09975E|nr:hypothetical protein [[Clostridium] scindens]MCB6285510.1 hypothetical protein [[Clostridium] scindens]MCB6420207.1 hypothetical protein [[Clostridium] scindens]MCB7191697.1 hypothetical protein [[Clostridium] scindens]MCB7284880.1 hypothetical protein [[Clostridium] scindens]MCG4928932.1 hypothetical protein [[Clostridium] scindens]